jgi:HSP20 family protein
MSESMPRKRKQGAADPVPEQESNPLLRLRRELDSLLDRFWNQWPLWTEELFGRERTWGMDVRDEEDEIVVEADAPGFEAEAFDVQISGSDLVIKAERKAEPKDQERPGHRHGRFQRVIPLPQGVEADKVVARYRNGVLEIRIPKGKAARGTRIPVKRG